MLWVWDNVSIALNSFALLSGVFLLVYGADLFVVNTAVLARRLSVSETFIALLAVEGEWEELAIVIVCLLRHEPALALGNVIGSTIANILGAFSLSLLDHTDGMVFGGEAKFYSALLLIITSVFAVLGLTGHLDLTGGILLLQGFLIYVASIGWGIYEGFLSPPTDGDSARTELSESSPLLPNISTIAPPRIGQRIEGTLNNIFRVFMGLVALSISGFVMSHCASTLATTFNISATLFGATVLSLSTAFLPKLIRRVQSGVPPGKATVIASTTASNIFLLTVCMGAILVTNPEGNKGVASAVIPFEIWCAWVSSIVLVFIVWIWGRPWMGGLLLGFYAAFIGSEFSSYRR